MKTLDRWINEPQLHMVEKDKITFQVLPKTDF
jgi:regulation of enolase protein 1 (concanavalin A-like superfamily)